jgi:hypothetical protein
MTVVVRADGSVCQHADRCFESPQSADVLVREELHVDGGAR